MMRIATTMTAGRLAALACAATLIATAGTAVAAIPAAATTEPSVLVFDQAPKNGAVNVSYAYLPQDGYVLIYSADADGKRSADPIGSAALKAGDHRDVSVKLTAAPAPGAKLLAVLYQDKDGKPGPTRGTDVSFWPDGKIPSENAFTVR